MVRPNDTAEKEAKFLGEHLPYEFMMLRYCLLRIHNAEQLDYNAFYEAFAVHVRNVLRFLRDKADGGFRRRRFNPQSAVGKAPIEIATISAPLTEQVLHIGMGRPTN